MAGVADKLPESGQTGVLFGQRERIPTTTFYLERMPSADLMRRMARDDIYLTGSIQIHGRGYLRFEKDAVGFSNSVPWVPDSTPFQPKLDLPEKNSKAFQLAREEAEAREENKLKLKRLREARDQEKKSLEAQGLIKSWDTADRKWVLIDEDGVIVGDLLDEEE